MESLRNPIWDIPSQSRPMVPTPLDRRRLERLGHGTFVDRERLHQVCGSQSAANQWLDKMSKEGALVPVAWGEYRVVDEHVLNIMRYASAQAHRRLVSWAMTLPTTLHAKVSFLAPRIWTETNLPWTNPAPVVPFDATDTLAPPQLGAVGYSLLKAETWSCTVGDSAPIRVQVASRVDAVILLGSNADSRWQHTAAKMAQPLGPAELRYARQHLARLRRFGSRSAVRGERGSPAVRTPRWWNQVHERAAEELVKDVYAI